MAQRSDLDWLRRPIAHRGLHDAAAGIVENSASAIRAAVEAGYAVEVDLQRCKGDGHVVFHDAALDRLTDQQGALSERDGPALCAIPLRGSADTILALPDLLRLVGGRVPLILEVKSRWDGGGAFEANIAAALKDYSGPVAVMSFDPHCLAAFRKVAPHLPRGLVAERFEDATYWNRLSPLRRFAMRHLLTAAIARPDFVAYDIGGLPAPGPAIARKLGLPLLAWTVRTEADRARAAKYADAPIFEAVRP